MKIRGFEILIIGIIVAAGLLWIYSSLIQPEPAVQEIRIKVVYLNISQVRVEDLQDLIEQWGLEINEIWLYYGTKEQLSCQAFSSYRPSIED